MHRKNLSFKLAFASVMLVAIASCSSTEVKTEKDPQANLAQYKTYAWAPPSPGALTKPNASILDETVKADTDQQLTAKGLQQTSPDQADLLVSYSARTKDKVTYGAEPGYWGWGAPAAYVTPEGTLTVMLVDPKMHRTIWQGSATDTVSSAGASQEQVGSAIKDIFKKYPAA